MAVNGVVGYALDNVPQGFTVMDAVKSARVFASLFPASEVHLPDADPPELEDAFTLVEGDLDRRTERLVRVEQDALRQGLFGDRPTAACALCGEELPVDLLVAAHIKRRASCDERERRDVPANVMAACVFGCDDLFERGYIGVGTDGRLVATAAAPHPTAALVRRLAHLGGRSCAVFGPSNAGYFAWHLTRVFRDRPRPPV